MFYSCIKNKGANPLRSYHAADLRLCFNIYKMLFPQMRLMLNLQGNADVSSLNKLCICPVLAMKRVRARSTSRLCDAAFSRMI